MLHRRVVFDRHESGNRLSSTSDHDIVGARRHLVDELGQMRLGLEKPHLNGHTDRLVDTTSLFKGNGEWDLVDGFPTISP